MNQAEGNTFQVPPTQKMSFASLVSGTTTARQSTISSAAPGDINLVVKDGSRFLDTSAHFRAKLCEPLKQTIVLRLVGKKVDIQYLYNRLRSLWNPVGRFRMVDLESEVFLASFEDSHDYFHALSGGPWTILGHYLVAFAWDPLFRVTDDLPQRMVVWIRFPRLPYQYYHRDVLDGLGNLVGKTVRPDIQTLNSIRGKFARIAVEVDLSKPLPKGVFVDGVWQVVEYENLPSFCRGCGCFGHFLDSCESRFNPAPIADDSTLTPTLIKTSETVAGDLPEPTGHWQVVTRRSRRKNKETSQQLNASPQSQDLKVGKSNLIYPKSVSNGQPLRDFKKASKYVVTSAPPTAKLSQSKEAGSTRTTKLDLGSLKFSKSGPSTSGLSPSQKIQSATGGSIKPKLTNGVGIFSKSSPHNQSHKASSPALVHSVIQSPAASVHLTKSLNSPVAKPPIALSYPSAAGNLSLLLTSSTKPSPDAIADSIAANSSPDSTPSVVSQQFLCNPPVLPHLINQVPKVTAAAPTETLSPVLDPSPAMAPTSTNNNGGTTTRSTSSRTSHGVSIHRKIVAPQLCKMKKKKISLLGVHPDYFESCNIVPLANVKLDPLLPPSSALVPAAPYDSTLVTSDEDLVDRSLEEVVDMCLGNQGNEIQQNGSPIPTTIQT
ncbi:hypothetical protein LINGRAHAP2_LOCUS1628 [Linum grandiflorum]